MGVSVTLPKGFMDMIKFYQEEMQKGNVERFEKSEIGTLLKEEGEQIAVICIMGYKKIVDAAEEKWILDRVRKFISLVELELGLDLRLWSGSVTESKMFNQRLREILGSVINLGYINPGFRFYGSRKGRIRLRKKLEKLDNRFSELQVQLEKGKIKSNEYNERKRMLKRDYNEAKKEYVYTILLLSRISLNAEKLNKQTNEEIAYLKNKFFELKSDLNELQRKENLTSREIEKRKQLEQEILRVIRILDSYMDQYLNS